MIDEKKLIEEIEKLKSNLIHGACSSRVAMETRCKEEAYNEVLAILDTMKEEPVSEDLEEAADKYAEESYPDEPSSALRLTSHDAIEWDGTEIAPPIDSDVCG